MLQGYQKGGTAVSYTYDMNGIRRSKTVNGVLHTYFIDGTRIYSEKAGSQVYTYLYDASGITGIRTGGDCYYFLKTQQGDVKYIVSSSGVPQCEYVYDAWGNHRILSAAGEDITDNAQYANSISHINPFRYRGYYYDTETGLYYLQSRYYDPETGRFINADSVMSGAGGAVQGYNLFAYCINNPVNMSDSAGRWPQWLDDIADDVINWFDDNIVQPVKKFYYDIKEDFHNYDMNNQSEQKVLESHYFSAYKGVPVVRISGNRSGSFGAIFLTYEANYRDNPEDVVRHEYGHTEQLRQLGVVKYAIDIGIPSAKEIGGGDYYSRPWEITADIYGGVQSRQHTKEDIEAGFSYLERSKNRGPFVWLMD